MEKYSCDMIANLNHLPSVIQIEESIKIKQAFIGDKRYVMEFAKEHFYEGWSFEVERAMLQDPSKCFIATCNNEIVGFACYDATAKGFFGPIGVLESQRGKKVGAALLIRTLHAMRENGYIYAIIGWVDDAEAFYRKLLNAEFIPGGEPRNSIYANMITMK